MRALRCTMFPPHDFTAAVTVVVQEDALRVSLEELKDQQAKAVPGSFIIFDIFECAVGNEVSAAIEGEARAQRRRKDETNMALSYYWNAGQLQRIAPGGVLMNPAPAPLSSDDIETVERQLAQHPNFRPGVRIMCTSEPDGELVTYHDGEVERVKVPV